jgi:hypothetical protein
MKTNEPRDLVIVGIAAVVFSCGFAFWTYSNHKSLYDIRVFNDTSIAVEVEEVGGLCDGKVLPGKYLEAGCRIYNPNCATLELRIASWGEDYELDLYHVVRAYQKLPDKTKPVIVNVSEFVLRGRRSKGSMDPKKADLQRKLRRMEELAPSRFEKQRN